ncbi:hypothetical protein GYMLUDRAFT_40317 [Collybiopsis luxurians FD-317 M1]|uniref:Uncharacterized protein n=1 Tax=Collybiopsis luxurians FD-317 M1 TaxID=944289 RepID=A0A0D0C7E2_9AGAR|nr:hypothetical protein GYMLUDRAFT_40317 [Collybiopsis luxurians FD-317 M1]
MGIAESVSAVGMAGTVTGLSYTQATAQQREDEEEAKRQEAAAQQAQQEAAGAANAGAGRRGADESGPSKGMFPASANLAGGRTDRRGGGRGPGPGPEGNANGERAGKDGAGGRNENDGAGRKKQPHFKSRKDKKQKQKNNKENGPDIQQAAESNDLASDAPQNRPDRAASAAQSPVPGLAKSRRRGAGRRQTASNTPSRTAESAGQSVQASDVGSPEGAVRSPTAVGRNRRKNRNLDSKARDPKPLDEPATTSSPEPASAAPQISSGSANTPLSPSSAPTTRSRKPQTQGHTAAGSQAQQPDVAATPFLQLHRLLRNHLVIGAAVVEEVDEPTLNARSRWWHLRSRTLLSRWRKPRQNMNESTFDLKHIYNYRLFWTPSCDYWDLHCYMYIQTLL